MSETGCMLYCAACYDVMVSRCSSSHLDGVQRVGNVNGLTGRPAGMKEGN